MEQQKKRQWRRRWKYWVSLAPVATGVFAVCGGGFLIRARITDPRTTKRKTVQLYLKNMTLPEARRRRAEEIETVRAALLAPAAPQRTRFATFAKLCFKRKVDAGDLSSPKSIERWETTLRLHLIPRFGEIFMDELRRTDTEAWRADLAVKIKNSGIGARTANGFFAIARVIFAAAAAELELDRNPMVGIKDFDTSICPTHTDEQPNSLLPAEVSAFLRCMRDLFPAHFAMALLGFCTGLRPSSLRAIRRIDVLVDEGVLLVRRSNPIGQCVIERTKTGIRQRLALPPEIMQILKQHLEQLPDGPMSESELLFPARHGGYRARSVLDKPFAAICTLLKLKKKITPRAMRRTFQDLARAAQLKDVVTMAVSGHATDQMRRHYSTVNADEMRAGLAKVVSIAGFPETHAAAG
jgi:integrase